MFGFLKNKFFLFSALIIIFITAAITTPIVVINLQKNPYKIFKNLLKEDENSFIGFFGSENCPHCTDLENFKTMYLKSRVKEGNDVKNLGKNVEGVKLNNTLKGWESLLFSDSKNPLYFYNFEKDFDFGKRDWRDNFWKTGWVKSFYKELFNMAKKDGSSKIGKNELEWDNYKKEPKEKAVPIVFFIKKGKLKLYSFEGFGGDKDEKSDEPKGDDKGKDKDEKKNDLATYEKLSSKLLDLLKNKFF